MFFGFLDSALAAAPAAGLAFLFLSLSPGETPTAAVFFLAGSVRPSESPPLSTSPGDDASLPSMNRIISLALRPGVTAAVPPPPLPPLPPLLLPFGIGLEARGGAPSLPPAIRPAPPSGGTAPPPPGSPWTSMLGLNLSTFVAVACVAVCSAAPAAGSMGAS